MKSKGLICCVFVIVSLFCAIVADDKNVTVTVTGNEAIAETDESFVCATLDWWPQTKCDYNMCPWGKAGILNLDLDNKILENAVKAFGNLRIRIGGSLQDQVLYNIKMSDGVFQYNVFENCSDFTKENGSLFGYSSGCLDMERWDQMNTFFQKTGAVITFGLNALNGRKNSRSDDTLMVGDWNYTNALDFMNYTASKGYKIDSYEFGNELSGSGIAARVEAKQYANDTKVLQDKIKSLDSKYGTNLRLVGPGGFYDEPWYTAFLTAERPRVVVDAVTYHIYDLGSGDNPTVLDKILNPDVVNDADNTYENVVNETRQHTNAPVWVSESGGASNSGRPNVSNTYVNGFWYLNQLGLASKNRHEVFCRQTLIGGHYGLLDVETFKPNPDYYGALLWHRLMGKKVLSASHNGTKYLRVYALCSKLYYGGISLLIINMSNSTTFNVRVKDSNNLYPFGNPQNRTEYHLTPENDDILSDVVLLNGTPLKLTETSDIPLFNPRFVDATLPIRVDNNSMVFATIGDYNTTVCNN